MTHKKIYFFRPNVDFNRINPVTMNEVVTIKGKDYETFGTKEWTALIPVRNVGKKRVSR